MVVELTHVNTGSPQPGQPAEFVVSANILSDQKRGGSYTVRSFLRTAFCSRPPGNQQQQVIKTKPPKDIQGAEKN